MRSHGDPSSTNPAAIPKLDQPPHDLLPRHEVTLQRRRRRARGGSRRGGIGRGVACGGCDQITWWMYGYGGYG